MPSAGNISELFNEMLHPYLEEERRQHENTLKGEQQKARARSARDREKIRTEAHARQAVEEELQRQRSEDLTALESLCRDVSITLKRWQRGKKAFAGFGALVLAILTFLPLPDYIEPKWAVRLVGLAATIIMAYLTITGSSLLRLDISKESAREELEREAQRRALAQKLERHNAVWDGDGFTLTDKSVTEKTGLL